MSQEFPTVSLNITERVTEYGETCVLKFPFALTCCIIIIIHSFYIALFSALVQTHCSHQHVILNECIFFSFFSFFFLLRVLLISTEVVYW